MKATSPPLLRLLSSLRPLASGAVALGMLASVVSARPPTRLEAVRKALQAAALHPDAADQGALAATLEGMIPFLPAAVASAAGEAVQLQGAGDLAGAARALGGAPWPAVTAQPLGAARRVTGSMHLVRAPGANLLIDCGLAQGKPEEADALNRREFSFDPAEIDAVVITHAHIDHMGLLPRLAKEGYQGPVLCTATTAAIMEISLKDSARLQYNRAARDLGYNPRKRLPKEAHARIEAACLYGERDVHAVLELVKTIDYDAPRQVANGVQVKMRDAGHLPGSSVVEVVARAGDRDVRLVFGGDTGNIPYPLLRRPSTFEGADVLFLESTYGDRHHKAVDMEERFRQFGDEVLAALEDGGPVLMPAFAVGRSQVLLAWLDRMKDEGRLPADTPIVLDSPMAGKTLRVLQRHPESLDPEQIDHLFGKDGKFFWVQGFQAGRRRGEALPRGAIVIASSGMLTGGKAIAYAQELLPDPKADLIFSGYAGPRTPARKLMDGATRVRIGDREVEVRARIRRLSGFSGHADQGMLIEYVRTSAPKRVVLVHGEPESGETLEREIEARTGIVTDFPERGRAFVLAE